ncbi:glycoside hydrolase family 1 protein [uncultured Collinsella sp.]|uniref:glycoside hydrolase family 1 protein n=1 Tax=uncultured Collinsella sp. TaxID=165190 RepID=UPI0025FE1C41|nr:glycoside hydrolase family 1 protein [uncultured Collinsella sp.]
MDVKFPEGFYFGSATSAAQAEGAHTADHKAPDIWDLWFEEEPYKFHGGVGPADTSTFFEHWREDIELLHETGQNSFRTSISWSRLLPDPEGDPNPEAVEFYRNVFGTLRDEDIEPFVNLFHFDMPVALQERGGWESREVVDLYERYARIAFELFGDVVKRWYTFNEPIVHVECGYLQQYHYPCKVDPKAAAQVAYHTALASALAVRACHEVLPDAKIGIVLNLTPAYPRSENPADARAAHIAELFANKSFLDPSVHGAYDLELVELIKKHGLMPVVDETDLAIILDNTVDYLGVNFYQPLRVCARASLPNPEAPFMPTYYYDVYAMPGRRMNPHRGWEIYPHALYDIAINLRDNYGNIEWIVSENGMGVEGEEKFRGPDGAIQDDYRIDFIKEHLTELARGIDEGSNCIGYHLWTFIDCWSWLNAYKNRYGLVELDLETQERRIKKSGRWYKQLAESRGF